MEIYPQFFGERNLYSETVQGRSARNISMLTKRHILSAILASALSLSAASAHANVWNSPVVMEAQRSISPAEAKSIARKKVPNGEVVDIKRRGDTYSVRVIKKSGKVVDVLIDANTGRVKKKAK